MFHSVLLPDTVRDGVCFDMEADFGFVDDTDAHDDGASAVEYIGGHERPVFGKRDR